VPENQPATVLSKGEVRESAIAIGAQLNCPGFIYHLVIAWIGALDQVFNAGQMIGKSF
jgi:hypothetical protein